MIILCIIGLKSLMTMKSWHILRLFLGQTILFKNTVKIGGVTFRIPPNFKVRNWELASAFLMPLVKPFGLYDDIEILGQASSTLKPHILLYEDDKPHLVLEYFANLVQQYKATGQILNITDPIKAIGWVGKPVEQNKIFIPNYHPSYNKDNNKRKKIDYSSLLGYLQSVDPANATFREVRNCILSAILKALRIQGIQNAGREYTKTQFLNEVRLNSLQLHEALNSNLLAWCNLIIFGNDRRGCQEAISNYLPTFLTEWKTTNVLIPELTNFLTAAVNVGLTQSQAETNTNSYEHNGVNIEVTTVHAVKGETHSATLYMETYYYSFETEKCLNQFLGISATGIGSQVRKREAARMMYVGLSRATCFLSFAAAKSRLLASKAALEQAGWEVREV